jgi:hypothetical protein
MVEVVEGYDCVVEVGWRWVDVTFGPVMALGSTSVGEGCLRCTITLRASPALCSYVVCGL